MDKEGSGNAPPPNDMELLQNHCMELFSLPDYVMEPQVVQSMLAFFQAGGAPEKFVDLLSAHYQALAQTANLLGKWLSDLEMDNGKSKQVDDAQKIESCASVRECLETAICSMVSKVFSPDAADKIFDGEATEGIDWLPQLISHRPWRRMIYELADQYPQCLMLNFAVKLISDAGFQHEISNVNTATQQLEIFSRVFLSSIQQLLEVYGKGENTEVYEHAFTELVKVACHSEQTYLYTQAMLHVMAEKESGKISSMSAHVSQSLRLVFEGKEQESTALTLFIGMIQSESDSIPANCIQAMLTMVTKRSLNPADINQLYQAYFEPFPPPVGLIRDPLFFNMLIDALFSFTSPKVNAEHRPKYVYLLSYAASVGETTKNGIRVQSKNELDATRGKIDDLLNILKSSDDLLMCFNELQQLVKLPVAACALLHFLKTLIMREEFLGEPLPVHLTLLDQIATNHPNLHSRLFKALCELYDYESTRNEVAEVVMERQRSIIDRFVHLISAGCVIPAIEKIQRWFKDGQVDVSLVRYFGVEVLEMIEPPYSREFLQTFVPIVVNPEVFDHSTLEKTPLAKDFIDHCTTLRNS